MKTKEFIKKVEELGFYVDKERRIFSIYGSDDQTDDMPLAFVDRYYPYQINSSFMELNTLNNTAKKELFKLLTDYASTPIEERQEDKKFYLRHRWFKCTNGDSRYFQIYESDGTPWLNAMYTVKGYKKQFTLKEIEEIKKKFDTDLADFEIVEVEE